MESHAAWLILLLAASCTHIALYPWLCAEAEKEHRKLMKELYGRR